MMMKLKSNVLNFEMKIQKIQNTNFLLTLVLPSRKKNRQTIVPNRFMAVISTVEGGFFLTAVRIRCGH